MTAKYPDSPTRLTEFAPLSSDTKQSGGFFSKLFKKSTVEASPQTIETSTELQDAEDGSQDSSSIKDAGQATECEDDVPGGPGPSPEHHRRTLSSVLRRLSNILDTRGQTPQVYKDSDFKQYWMPDNHCKECYECGDRFNTFRRRHHCRICGQIFCSRCCNQEVPGKIMGYTGFLRVCTYCCKVVLSYAQSQQVTGDLQTFGEDLRRQMIVAAGEPEHPTEGSLQNDSGKWTLTNKRKGHRVRMTTIFDEESQGSVRSSPDPAVTLQTTGNPFDVTPINELETLQTFKQERKCLLQDSKKLREICQCLVSPDEGLELQNHRHHLRTYPGCLVGNEIVDWLIQKEKAMSREQAVAIGQALLDNNWLECVSTNQQVFTDLYALYRPDPIALEDDDRTEESSIPAPDDPEDDPEDDSAPLWFKAIERNQALDKNNLCDLSELTKIPSTVSVPENLGTSSKSVFYVETPEASEHVKHIRRFRPLSATSLNERVYERKQLGRIKHTSESGSELTVDIPDDIPDDREAHDWEILDYPEVQRDVAPANRLAESRPAENRPEENRMVENRLVENRLAENRLAENRPAENRPAENRASDHSLPTLKEGSRPQNLSPYHLLRQDSVGASFALEFIKGTSPSEEAQKLELETSGGWQETETLREDNGDRIAFDRLRTGHKEHMTLLVRQLLRHDGLSLKWADTILTISRRVALQVRPDVRHEGDDMDIQQYVTIKKIPGGLRSYTSVICGVVFTKVVAHKRMKPNIVNPKVLLLRGPIEYQRVENKFSSLEPQILQEHEFLKNCVGRISALEPDILLVEKTVSRLAQEFILDAGITLVLNVKPSVMERVSRFTTADIVTSIDGLVSKTTMGYCHSFKTHTYILPDGRQKNLLYFDGCASHLGCTITLRGGSTRELIKVKGILHFMILVAYHSKLEVAFLMDEFALPPPGPGENALELLTPEALKQPLATDNNSALSQEVDTNHSLGGATSSEITEDNSKDISGDISNRESNSSCNHLGMPVEAIGQRSRSPSRARSSPRTVEVPGTAILDQSDPLQNYQLSQDESIFKTGSSHLLTEVKQTGHHFKQALNDTILSMSPHMKYEMPYLETENGAKCVLRKFFSSEIYWSQQFHNESHDLRKHRSDDVTSDDSKVKGRRNTYVTRYHPFVVCKITAPITDLKTQSLLADFRARGGYFQVLGEGGKTDGSARSSEERESSPFVWNPKVDCLDPMRHQRIAVLFSSFSLNSPNHPNPCVSPWVVTMDYYGRNDITLGGFLERYCFRESYTCPAKSCDALMVEHVRRFVHEFGSVQVILKKLEKPMPAYQNNILMWAWCKKCKEVTPVVPMSLETWSMSFAKYLEIRLHGTVYNKRSSSSNCTHSLQQEHFQYFGFKDIVASFKYFPITLKEITLPPMILDIRKQEVFVQQWHTQQQMLSYKGIQVFNSILDHLLKCQTLSQTEAQAGIVTDYINQVQDDKVRFKRSLEELKQNFAHVEEVCGSSDEGQGQDQPEGQSSNTADEDWNAAVCQMNDCILRAKRDVAQAVLKWNTKIVDFTQQQKKLDKERNKHTSSTSLRKDCSSVDGTAESLATRWLPKEEELETEPTFIVKETGAVSLDTQTALVAKEAEGDTESVTMEIGVPDAGPETTDCEQTESTVSGVDSPDLISTLDPSHFASSPVSIVTEWSEGSVEIAAQGGATITSVPDSMSSTTSSRGSLTGDKCVPCKSGSADDLDSVPKVIQGEGQDSRGHQRSISLGESRKMSKQLTLAREGSSSDLEKKTVKTMLSNLLSGAGSDPIQMPFSAEEHHILSQVLPPADGYIPIIVYDQEPSSIIAYALSCPDYNQKLEELRLQQVMDETNNSPYTRRKHAEAVNSSDVSDYSEPVALTRRISVLSFFRGGGTARDKSPIHQAAAPTASSKKFDIEAVKYTPRTERDSVEDIDEPDYSFFSQSTEAEKAPIGGSISASMRSSKDESDNCHIELLAFPAYIVVIPYYTEFSDATANFYCKVYFADQFRKLRKLIFPSGENRYIRSLSRCFTWLVKGGKSGSSFCKTQDDRFILKQMSRYEVQSFNKFAPHYFNYITKANGEQKPTVLAKILGVYRIGFKNSQTFSENKQDLLVMENLFYNRDITQIFDLKGSLRNRLVTTMGKRVEDLVLLDENLLKLSIESPLYIRPHSKTVLSLAVTNDTQFLSRHLVMDYSMLVGVDETSQELVLGIIDYIRTFTWDKKLEMVVKSTYSQFGGQGKMPTVVYPESYRSRFIQSMDRYFLPVPDRWAGLGRDVDC